MTPMDHAYAEEHGLVDAYLKDRLSESERDAFEAHFFACPACLEQLEMANDFREGMRDVAAEETARVRLGLLAGFAAASPGRRIVLSAALLLLLALPFGLLLTRNRSLERQLAEARNTPVPAGADSRIARLEGELRNLRQAGAGHRRRLEEELAKERQARAAAEKGAEALPRVNVPIFMLAAVRSGEDPGREPANRLPLPATDGPVLLTLELAVVDFPTYRASLRDEAGREVWQARGLRPDSRDTLTILLPSSMLASGIYELKVEGAKDDGKMFAVGVYPFRALR